MIPNSVTSIGDSAFNSNTSLTEVIFPDSVTRIEAHAFSKCTNLNKITLSKSLTYIGGSAFEETAVESIEIPKSLEECNTSGYCYYTYNNVQYYTIHGPFAHCDSLKNVTFEQGITKIPNSLFCGCTGIENVTIPDTVTTIDYSAFRDCLRLKNVNIGNSITTINHQAFYQCVSLLDVVIPNSVTSIGDSAFNSNTSLTEVILSDGITKIEASTFSDCKSLKFIDLPKTITTIQKNAFKNCTALESFTFSEGDSNFEEVYENAFYGCSSLKEAILPETTKTIRSSAFQNCTSLEKVYIPQSTKTIYSQAFMGCEALTDITIADYSITKIESSTFKDCPSLKKIVLPKGLTTIGSQAFMNCTGLTEVYIPESVTSIDSTAFSYPQKTTIYGKTGSYAETFANDGGFKFVDNTVAAEGIALVDGIEYVAVDKGETYRAVIEYYPENSTDVITLTANNSNVTISGHDIYARYTGDTIITATASSGVTYEFTIHIRDARSISVINQPTKLSYVIGDTLDLSGMTVQVKYSDDTVKDVTDYTVTGFDSSVEGEQTVTVNWVSAYGSTYKTTFTVNVVDTRPKLTGIYIDSLPDKLDYARKESLDLTGMVIKGTYTDGSKAEITDYTISGYNALKSGIQIITVAYGDFTTTFTVTVGLSITGVEIASKPSKTSYYVDSEFEIGGLTLKVSYSDGSSKIIDSGFTTSGFDSSEAGEKTITVVYGGFSDTFTVTVREKGSATPGDVNDDGRINNKDLGLLMQYLNDWEITIVEEASDVNADGKINNKDYGLLMQYLNDWDVVLK